MTYKDRYGTTTIIDGKIDNFSVGWDYDDNPEDKKQRFPVFLFTPNMENTIDHYHIALDREKSEILRDWLTAFLEDRDE